MAFCDILPNVWEHVAAHPEWSPDEAGDDGWDETVASWAVITPDGLVLIDPLIEAWDAFDAHVDAHGGCAAIVRTVHWHARDGAEAAARYDAPLCARRPPNSDPRWLHYDRELRDGEQLPGGLQILELPRADEVAVWFPAGRALFFGDAMLRRPPGELHVCPDRWLPPDGGAARMRRRLRELAGRLAIEHVLVSHGPNRLGDGAAAILAACDA